MVGRAVNPEYIAALEKIFGAEEIFGFSFPPPARGAIVGDFQTDVNRAAEWEERVVTLVKNRLPEGAPFRDVRDLKLPWDVEFAVGANILHVDIKVDFRSEETGNLALELYHEYPDGRQKRGWAYAEGLDQILVVQPNKKLVHRLLLPAWLIVNNTPPSGVVVTRRKHQNPGFETHVGVISIEDLKKSGVIKDTWSL